MGSAASKFGRPFSIPRLRSRHRLDLQHCSVRQFPFVRQAIALSQSQEFFPQRIDFAAHERAIDYVFGGESAFAARKNHSTFARDWLPDWHRFWPSGSKNWAASVPNLMVSCRFPNHYFPYGCLKFTRHCLKFRPAKSTINCRPVSSKDDPAILNFVLFFVRWFALGYVPWPRLPLSRALWLHRCRVAHASTPARIFRVK